jgi:hypothetical protein
MPCYLFTFHAYRSWLPDRTAGFVRRQHGVLPPDKSLAMQYRVIASENEVTFDANLQEILIDESRAAFEKQQCRGHYIATEPTHLHVLTSWADERPWLKIRTGLRSSITRRFNRDVQRRQNWFVDGSSRKQVKEQSHFDHLVNTYLPSHSGLKWQEGGEPFR